ncbi:MAG TPA: type 4a pilus biogenesis protein PilO [Longimicrobium sp.]|jgi:Tfp pilus assembly protein PilO
MTPALRARLALAVLLATSALTANWFWKSYRPRTASLSAREAELAAMLTSNRDARARELALGADSMEALRRHWQIEADRLAARVPPRGGSAQPLVDALSSAARRLGVRVHNYQPLQTAAEGQFQVDGLRVLVAGRYHDVGTLMAELLSQPRLTQLRGVRMAVVPDSLMRAQEPQPAASLPADTALVIPAGETPFNVVAAFSLHWFSLQAAPQPADTAGIPLDPLR